jgi:hypothetical protein
VQDPIHEFTDAEIEVLRRGSLNLCPPALGQDDPVAVTAAEYAALLATSHTVGEVAKLLQVDESRVRQRLAQRTLYGIKLRSGWRIPAFQFAGDRPLPGIEHVFPRLDPGLYPLSVFRWFLLPDVDLVLDDDDEPMCPRDWLRSGRDPRIVAALAAEL